jgi:hypothetical protein
VELKTPKKELSQQREIAQVKERFTAMCELTDMCTVRPDVSFYRKKFALRYFFKTAVPYGFFLMALLIGMSDTSGMLILCIVALGQARTSLLGNYFSQSIQNTFFQQPFGSGTTFGSVATVEDFWGVSVRVICSKYFSLLVGLWCQEWMHKSGML